MPQARDRGKVLLSAPKLSQFKGAAAKTGVPPEGNILLFLVFNFCVAGSDDDQHVQGREMNAPHELSIEEAKIGLSNKYDVPIDNIEITLRG